MFTGTALLTACRPEDEVSIDVRVGVDERLSRANDTAVAVSSCLMDKVEAETEC